MFFDTIHESYWRHIKKNASKRNIKLNVTKDECYELLVKQNFTCALSGIILHLSTNWVEHIKGNTTASLDRIDSNKDYEIDNIQWIHKDINRMKNIFDEQYFIEICHKISEYQTTCLNHDDQQV